jgi:hypothetical protein
MAERKMGRTEEGFAFRIHLPFPHFPFPHFLNYVRAKRPEVYLERVMARRALRKTYLLVLP